MSNNSTSSILILAYSKLNSYIRIENGGYYYDHHVLRLLHLAPDSGAATKTMHLSSLRLQVFNEEGEEALPREFGSARIIWRDSQLLAPVDI